MTGLTLPFPPQVRRSIAVVAGGAMLALAGVTLVAQVSGDRGIAPVASTTDISIGGISVNVVGENAEEARLLGWREAQRQAWKKLGGPDMPDERIQSMVSAIVIERERLGPRRYVATLGVVFDRARAGALLGADGERQRSAPLLTLPVLVAGGTQTMFEVRNPWQRAWAEYQTGGSAIDYVRPSGAGFESLLLTYGQVGRRSRAWWNNILDTFGAADIIVPVAHLRRQWPGGPVQGTFTARYGPDDTYLAAFTLTAPNEEALPRMLEQAVRRFDAIYTRALNDGILQPDPTLARENIEISPEVQALIEAARRAEEAAVSPVPPTPSQTAAPPATLPAAPDQQAVAAYTVQFATPDAAAVDAVLAAVRSVAGVRGAATTSIAIGGTSVMRVSFAGAPEALAAALSARGFQVNQSGAVLSIRR
ncbi:heavy-metal-associated domain-containing protein [Altererythrobacter soli]|uniref:Heavy-metal-associated domain-containing protein n=1 Tax=Croceibacterium soli TaxID=1739690 RepID=A0A6I4UYJ4_9SPHN|nr:heavy-metal-associated domain-containing protein [Croceibacterium soli]MXP42673.1 heavy-metal-associated domain-containing protein [Croceibacterium soli]